jgi:hypothetical protein
MWASMLDAVADFRSGAVDLARLVDDLRGLVVAADNHDESIRERFDAAWARLDGELELRTERWAPPGAASDSALASYLTEMESVVGDVLVSDATDEHS